MKKTITFLITAILALGLATTALPQIYIGYAVNKEGQDIGYYYAYKFVDDAQIDAKLELRKQVEKQLKEKYNNVDQIFSDYTKERLPFLVIVKGTDDKGEMRYAAGWSRVGFEEARQKAVKALKERHWNWSESNELVILEKKELNQTE